MDRPKTSNAWSKENSGAEQRLIERFVVCCAAMLLAATCSTAVAAVTSSELSGAIEKIRAVAAEGAGALAASEAWQTVAAADAEQLPVILGAMKGASPIGTNYLRAAVDAVAQREAKSGKKLSVEVLQKFYDDRAQAPAARRTAYELLQRLDEKLAETLMSKALDDPSLEMRYDAIARLLTEAEGLVKQEKKDEALNAYHKAFDSARDLDQVQAAAKQLKELGDPVDISQHFGFLMNWQLVAPFDNVGTKGFDVAYPPEAGVDLAAKYDGKSGPVSWVAHTTKDDLGVVDLNEALSKHKGAIAYAYTEIECDAPREVEFRLGCINGHKVWVNGKLILSNHVYHAGMEVDQYAAVAPLVAGKNKILVKIAQNEQEESWAQDWRFQLRVCDSLGTAILFDK